MSERRGFWPWGRGQARRATATPDAKPVSTARPPSVAGSGAAQLVALNFRVGWKRADPTIEADVKAFWARLNLLPPGIDPDARAREIVVAGYAGSTVVAVSTAVVQDAAFLRSRMAMFRAAVGPAFARPEVFTLIGAQTRAALEAWSRDNPEEGVMGMLTVLGAEANQVKMAPHRSETGLSLAGYTENDQKIMVAWFDHALV